MKNIDLSGFVGASGKPIFQRSAPAFVAPPRIAKTGPASFHKGFVVEAFSEEMLAEAERDASAKVAAWLALGPEKQLEAEKKGARAPVPFNRDRHLREGKPQRVNKRPYGSLSAAEACAELATKNGFVGVTVVALSKGDLLVQQECLL